MVAESAGKEASAGELQTLVPVARGEERRLGLQQWDERGRAEWRFLFIGQGRHGGVCGARRLYQNSGGIRGIGGEKKEREGQNGRGDDTRS